MEPNIDILTDEPVPSQDFDDNMSLDLDVDQLKNELGLDEMKHCLSMLTDQVRELSNAKHSTESVNGASSPLSSHFHPSGI